MQEIGSAGVSPPRGDFIEELEVGDRVLKYTGDYQLLGEIVAKFYTTTGKLRYVVEHSPGFLHIYSGGCLRLLTD